MENNTERLRPIRTVTVTWTMARQEALVVAPHREHRARNWVRWLRAVGSFSRADVLLSSEPPSLTFLPGGGGSHQFRTALARPPSGVGPAPIAIAPGLGGGAGAVRALGRSALTESRQRDLKNDRRWRLSRSACQRTSLPARLRTVSSALLGQGAISAP